MTEKLETLITETTNLAREYGHKLQVVRRGRSLRSRPSSAIVVCEQCGLTANLTAYPYKTERIGTITKISCIGCNKQNKEINHMAETVTKEIAMAAKHGDIFHHKILKQGPKGKRIPIRVRVSGKCQTWKQMPAHFRLPIKWGFYDSWAITHDNCHEWEKP